MVNKEDRFNNKRFKEVLAKYEAGQDNLDSLFFDVDDIMDIAEYYNYKADVDNARKAVAFAAHLYPTSPMVLILQARMALFSDFDIDKARHYAQLIEQQGCEDMEYFYLKAEMLLFEDYIYEADSYLESKIPLLDGEDLEDFYLDVAFIFLDYRLPEYAKAWLDRSNEKDDPDYLEAEGRIAFLMEDYDKCETIFKKLLENEPFAVPLWNTLASAQFLNGRLVESIDSSEYAIAISPNNPEALLNKARCLSTAYRFSEAAEFYERYLTQVPNDSSVRAMYGVALIAYGKYDEALSNLYQAKDTCTDKSLIPEIVKQLVFVLSKKGQTDVEIEEDNLPAFRQAINAWAADHAAQPEAVSLQLDAAVTLGELSLDNVQELGRLAPFGRENPTPALLVQHAFVDGIWPMGSEGRHTRLRLRQGSDTLFASTFGVAPQAFAYPVGSEVEAALEVSIFNGRSGPMVSAHLKAIRPAGLGNTPSEQAAWFEAFRTGGTLPADRAAVLLPDRADTVALYRRIRTGQVAAADLQPVFAAQGVQNTGRMLASLTALQELGLIEEQDGRWLPVPVTAKQDLASAPVLQRLATMAKQG